MLFSHLLEKNVRYMLNSCRPIVFWSVGPIFNFFFKRKNYTIIFLNSDSLVLAHTFSMTTHCTPLHMVLCSGPLDPGLIKVWKLLVLCSFTLSSSCMDLLLVCVCSFKWFISTQMCIMTKVYSVTWFTYAYGESPKPHIVCVCVCVYVSVFVSVRECECTVSVSFVFLPVHCCKI